MSAPLATTVPAAYDATVGRVRAALANQGFGVLTEIDLQATLRAKLGVEVAPQIILGACRPELAHRALEVAPSVATLLPCNVVVRELAPGSTRVEAVDPDAMMSVVEDPSGELSAVAAEARDRLAAALAALDTQD